MLSFPFSSHRLTKLFNHHDLVKLSDTAGAILRRLFPDDRDLEVVVKRIVDVSSQFHEIDPTSLAYRYPIDRDGAPCTPRNQTVNLNALARTMTDILENLETIDFGLNVETDIAANIHDILDRT